MDPQFVSQYEALERHHWWWRVRRRILLRELARANGEAQFQADANGTIEKHAQMQPTHAPALLELGCGAGTNLGAFESRFQCAGMEPDATLCEAAKRNAPNSDIRTGYLPDGVPDFGHSFDIICLLDVIEHVEDDSAALRTAAAMLKPNGLVVINVPAMPQLWSIHDEVNRHFRRYTWNSLKSALISADLNILRMTYWGSFLVPIAWLSRKFTTVGREDYKVSVPAAPINAVMNYAVDLDARFSPLNRLVGLSLAAIACRR